MAKRTIHTRRGWLLFLAAFITTVGIPFMLLLSYCSRENQKEELEIWKSLDKTTETLYKGRVTIESVNSLVTDVAVQFSIWGGDCLYESDILLDDDGNWRLDPKSETLIKDNIVGNSTSPGDFCPEKPLSDDLDQLMDDG